MKAKHTASPTVVYETERTNTSSIEQVYPECHCILFAILYNKYSDINARANSVDSVQGNSKEQFDQGQHCLPSACTIWTPHQGSQMDMRLKSALGICEKQTAILVCFSIFWPGLCLSVCSYTMYFDRHTRINAVNPHQTKANLLWVGCLPLDHICEIWKHFLGKISNLLFAKFAHR